MEGKAQSDHGDQLRRQDSCGESLLPSAVVVTIATSPRARDAAAETRKRTEKRLSYIAAHVERYGYGQQPPDGTSSLILPCVSSFPLR